MLIDIEEYKNEIPEVVKKMELVIIMIKIIESEIETFPDKELFTTILYFIREEGIYVFSQLYNAVIYEKEIID